MKRFFIHKNGHIGKIDVPDGYNDWQVADHPKPTAEFRQPAEPIMTEVRTFYRYPFGFGAAFKSSVFIEPGIDPNWAMRMLFAHLGMESDQ